MEDMMSTLKSLTFTTLPKIDTRTARRENIVRRLLEQKKLIGDANYVRETKNRKGETKTTKVAPWFRRTTDGAYVLFIQNGWKPIEFQPGKSAIIVPSLDKLPETIDALIAAVRAGELDAQLSQ